MLFSEKNQLIRENITIQLAAMDDHTTITDKVVIEIGSVYTNHWKRPLPDRRAQENATVPALIPGNFSQQ